MSRRHDITHGQANLPFINNNAETSGILSVLHYDTLAPRCHITVTADNKYLPRAVGPTDGVGLEMQRIRAAICKHNAMPGEGHHGAYESRRGIEGNEGWTIETQKRK